MAHDDSEGMGKCIINIAVPAIGQVGDRVQGEKGLAETAHCLGGLVNAHHPASATIIARREGSFIPITPPQVGIWPKNESA